MKHFNRTLTFDFGASNTKVYENGRVVFDEPTVVAHWPNGAASIGRKALIYYSRYCEDRSISNCELIKPIINGYVGNYDAFETYVKGVVKILVRLPWLCLRTVIIIIPDDLVGDDNASACDRAFFEPFRKMGVKNIRTIHKSYAAYLGINK